MNVCGSVLLQPQCCIKVHRAKYLQHRHRHIGQDLVDLEPERSHKPCLEDKQSFSSHKPGLVLAEVNAEVMPIRGRTIRGVQVKLLTLGCMPQMKMQLAEHGQMQERASL